MMNLEAKNITFSYNKKRQILKDVSLSLNSNQIIGLMGDSGSGKSTLCKILSGYLTHYSGEVTIDGNKIPDKDFYPVQLIFQHPEKTMNPKWKMEKVLNESWTPPQDLKDTFGLKDQWLTRWPSELSGGELQRFSILRALNPKTKFIIADEISTMLDAVTQVQIWEKLINYAKANNIGILAVSHDPELLEVICDDILLFNEINNL
jgi:peptide/nickel transport system ATP-binding protein